MYHSDCNPAHSHGYYCCSLFLDDMYEEDGKVGDTFMRMIEPVASSVPYMVCLGNHESHYNFLHYTMRFINQVNTISP
jgi:hypothetical protein